MVTIGHWAKILKREPQQCQEISAESLSPDDVIGACQGENHQWRERFWTPLQTIQTFLLQVLHVGSSYRESAATSHGRDLHRLSFAGTVQRLDALAPYLVLHHGTTKALTLYQLLLKWIAHDTLPFRPNRIDPRAVKRRPKQYPLLNKPRGEMRKALMS